MPEITFSLQLPIAMPPSIRATLENPEGRKYLVEKLFEASFHVEEESDHLIAHKIDPYRSYVFLFGGSKDDQVLFEMKVFTDTIANPHRFFLDTLLSELHMITSTAKEFLSDNTTLKTQSPIKPRGYTA